MFRGQAVPAPFSKPLELEPDASLEAQERQQMLAFAGGRFRCIISPEKYYMRSNFMEMFRLKLALAVTMAASLAALHAGQAPLDLL